MYKTLKNLFTVVCLAVTLTLILELLVTFLVEKPTTTTKLEKELEITDLPNVVACLDTGFNNERLKKYGYNINTDWEGVRLPDLKFIGWNGDKKNRPSKESLVIF